MGIVAAAISSAYALQAQRAGQSAPGTETAPPSRAIAVARGFIEACRKNDTQALDAQFLGGGRATVLENAHDEGTWESYRDHHLKPELDAMDGLAFQVEKEAERALGTTSVVTQIGSFSVPDAERPDQPRKFAAAVTYVVVDEAGSPKIAHLHWSSRAAKASTPAPDAKPPDHGHGAGDKPHKE